MKIKEITSNYASVFPEPLYSDTKRSLLRILGDIKADKVVINEIYNTLNDVNEIRKIIETYLDSDEELLDIVVELFILIQIKFRNN